jgi:hypothetical protein
MSARDTTCVLSYIKVGIQKLVLGGDTHTDSFSNKPVMFPFSEKSRLNAEFYTE